MKRLWNVLLRVFRRALWREHATVQDDRRFLAVQVWEWDGDHYELSMYLRSEFGDGTCATQVLRSRYYAVSIERLIGLMQRAGFTGVQRRDDVLFQPVIIGLRES